MKKKLPKSKRPTHFLRSRKSSPLSPGVIKKTPKRKVKQILKKLFAGFVVSFGLFIVSLGVLWIGFRQQTKIISPVPAIFSNVLGTSAQNNPSILIAQMKDALRKKNLSFSLVGMQGNDIVVILHDGTEVLFATDKDFSGQIDSLQVTIDNLTIEGKRISRVDMRFERPVVTFK